jgi:hypothetical protein
MKDGWEDLENVLDVFEERRAAELAASKAAELDEIKFRSTCVDMLERVVIPTFNAAGRSLGKRGHDPSGEVGPPITAVHALRLQRGVRRVRRGLPVEARPDHPGHRASD